MKLRAGDLVVFKADPARYGIGKVKAKGLTQSANVVVEFRGADGSRASRVFHPDSLELAHAFMRVA